VREPTVNRIVHGKSTRSLVTGKSSRPFVLSVQTQPGGSGAVANREQTHQNEPNKYSEKKTLVVLGAAQW